MMVGMPLGGWCNCLPDHQEPGCRINLDNCPVHTVQPATTEPKIAVVSRCNQQYVRPGGHQPGDRIVRCHRPAGHPLDEHREYINGDLANWWPAIVQTETPVSLEPGPEPPTEVGASPRLVPDDATPEPYRAAYAAYLEGLPDGAKDEMYWPAFADSVDAARRAERLLIADELLVWAWESDDKAKRALRHASLRIAPELAEDEMRAGLADLLGRMRDNARG